MTKLYDDNLLQNIRDSLSGALRGPCLACWFREDPAHIDLISKESFNMAITKGPCQGVSAVFFLVIGVGGIELLHDNQMLRRKITSQGLNASVTKGPYKGLSALYVLTSTHIGYELLLRDRNLAQKVTTEGLNTLIKFPVSPFYPQGSSSLWQICASQDFALLKRYPRWIREISKNTLNSIVLAPHYRGKSVLWFLCALEEGRELLQRNKTLINNITPKSLNMTACPRVNFGGGRSPLFYFFGNIVLFDLIKNDEEFLSKVRKSGLNALPHLYVTALSQLISHDAGQSLFKRSKLIQSKITKQGLYTAFTGGDAKGMSVFTLISSVFPDELDSLLAPAVRIPRWEKLQHISMFKPLAAEKNPIKNAPTP